MKKILLSLTILFFVFEISQAQINLIGMNNNFGSGTIDVVKWQALDASTIETYPTDLEAYYMGSSVFDAYNSNYYLTGIAANSGGLFSFNSKTNTQTMLDYTAFSNITEIDMSTGKIYNLSADSVGYFSVNEYDITSGTDSILGVVSEPGIQGIIVEATCFDSNNGILYYIGYDTVPSTCLYSIPVRNTDFSFSKTTLQTAGAYSNFLGVNYDNVNNRIFALNSVFDSTGSITDFNVVEINTTSGEVSVRGQLNDYPYFVAGSSSFDQNTGSLLWVGIDTNFVQTMIVFNTNDNTYQTGFVPGSVSEIVCDNNTFAQNAYPVTAINEKTSESFGIFPNPATKKINIEISNISDDLVLNIYNLNGIVCLTERITRLNTELNIESLKQGIYILTLQDSKSLQKAKLIVQ